MYNWQSDFNFFLSFLWLSKLSFLPPFSHITKPLLVWFRFKVMIDRATGLDMPTCASSRSSGARLNPAVGHQPNNNNCNMGSPTNNMGHQPNNNNCNGAGRLQYGERHIWFAAFSFLLICVVFLIFSSSNFWWSIEGEGTVSMVCFVNLNEQEMLTCSENAKQT